MRDVGRAVVVAALAAVVVVSGAVPARTSTFPGANGKIVFEMFGSEALDNEIFVVNADSTGVTDLTNDPANDREPCWSADGTKIAWAREVDNDGHIWVMNADGSGQTQITSGADEDQAPCWSPDGTKIVFRRIVQNNGELWIANADGSGTPTQLTTGNNDAEPTWSPDGTTIIFTRDDLSIPGVNEDIYAIPAAGGTANNLSNNPNNEFSPCYSPDGTKIAFERAASPDSQIVVMNADGSLPTPLATGLTGANSNQPCFSPDGTKIVFVFNFQLYLMNADGSGAAQLVATDDNATHPNWQPVPATATLVARFTG